MTFFISSYDKCVHSEIFIKITTRNYYYSSLISCSFLLRSLQTFCDLSPDHTPPLGGSIPDMVSTTGFFVGLQRVYQLKAAADRLVFQGILSSAILVRSYMMLKIYLL